MIHLWRLGCQINLILHIQKFLTLLRGEGGVQPQKMKFLCFDICCSPCFPASKMGSFVSQLQAVVEI